MNINPPSEGAEAPKPIVPKSAAEALRPEAGVPPPKRSRQSRNQFVIFLNFVVSIVFLGTLAAGTGFFLAKRAFDGPGPAETSATILIKPNTGAQEVANLLEGRGLISNARIFQLGIRAHGKEGKLKAGEYEIKARASMRDIMDLLESGKSVLYSLTIAEGITVAQAFQRIAENEILTGEMPAKMPPEGSIVTDTQRFTRGATRQQIIDKMLADQKKLVKDIWNRRIEGLPLANVDEFVTLASIVEKETSRGDERSRVAAVFINRLNKGMRLQSDPTVIYGLFGGKGKPADRPIFRSDLDKPTPYNTYLNGGLPPGPIANPGRAALEAVANPSKTRDLYFVADGSGGHVFAATLEEHNRNVARWRAVEKKQAEEAAAQDGNSAGQAGDSGDGQQPEPADTE